MSSDIAISLDHVSKVYYLYNRPVDRLFEAFHPFRKQYHHQFTALEDISFDVQRGDFIGIIGRNGSGKSTLLQLVCGIIKPTSGQLTVNGRIAALLELGAGFNPDFTGRENVYLNGSILGFTRQEIDNRFSEIESFADIGEFIDQPIKLYSTGMVVRLAFAVQAHVEPDIFIVDEALSVGDAYFQAKCTKRMSQLIENGVTILYVTHDVTSVPQLCNKAVYLKKGKIKKIGEPIDVVDAYLRDVRNEQYAVEGAEDKKRSGKEKDEAVEAAHVRGRQDKKEQGKEVDPKVSEAFAKRVAPYRYGTGDARVLNLELLNENGETSDHFYFREKVTIRATIEVFKTLDAMNCCVIIRNKFGVEIMHCTTREYGYKFPIVHRGNKIIVDISFENILQPLEAYTVHYTVNNTYALEDQQILDLIELAAVFSVTPDPLHPIYYLVWHPFEFGHELVQ